MTTIDDVYKLKAQEEELKYQIKTIASQILTKKARERLGNIRVVKPNIASQIEIQLIQLYRAGQIRERITEQKLIDILKSLQKKRDFKIRRR